MAGDSTLARPMTARSETRSAARLISAVRFDGGSAWTSEVTDSSLGGRKKSRWRTVWTKTKSTYSATAASAAKVSCVEEKVAPGALVVKVGRTRQSVASVITVAK